MIPHFDIVADSANVPDGDQMNKYKVNQIRYRNTGLSFLVRPCKLERKVLCQFGVSSERGFPAESCLSIKLGCALMGGCRRGGELLGDLFTGSGSEHAYSPSPSLLIICKIHKLHSKSIDFVLAFPQAELEEDIWMEIPLGVDIISEDGGSYVLQLRKNLYGLKQGSHN